MWSLDAASQGFNATQEVLGVMRIAVGAFFACSGWNKLTNESRHATLVATLKQDGVPLVEVNQWWVPTCEFLGGVAVVFGIFAPFAAFLLAVICAVACMAEGKERVRNYKPINRPDTLADWLYLPEVLYLVMLVVVVGSGGGAWKLL